MFPNTQHVKWFQWLSPLFDRNSELFKRYSLSVSLTDRSPALHLITKELYFLATSQETVPHFTQCMPGWLRNYLEVMNQGTFYSVPDEHIQRIQNELQPLRKQIADYEQNVAESKRRLSRCQSELTTALTPVRSSFRGMPRRPDVVNILQTSRNELNQLESSQATTRTVITQPGHPPARIRHYIKGVFTVAFGLISQCCGAGWWGGGWFSVWLERPSPISVVRVESCTRRHKWIELI